MPAELPPDLQLGPGVKGGQRLVEQEQPGVGGQRPGERHPLRLPAAERSRFGARRSSPGPSSPASAWAALRASCLPVPRERRPNATFSTTRQVREKQVVLEDVPDLAGGGRGPGCPLPGPPASSPSIVTLARTESSTSPARALSSVVLPEPFGPSTASTSPEATARSTSRSSVPSCRPTDACEAHRLGRNRSRSRIRIVSEIASSTTLRVIAASRRVSSAR